MEFYCVIIHAVRILLLNGHRRGRKAQLKRGTGMALIIGHHWVTLAHIHHSNSDHHHLLMHLVYLTPRIERFLTLGQMQSAWGQQMSAKSTVYYSVCLCPFMFGIHEQSVICVISWWMLQQPTTSSLVKKEEKKKKKQYLLYLMTRFQEGMMGFSNKIHKIQYG